jgi:hypothetical protein
MDSVIIDLNGIDYSILVCKNLDDKELSFGMLKEAVRWYHFSLSSKNESKTEV